MGADEGSCHVTLELETPTLTGGTIVRKAEATHEPGLSRQPCSGFQLPFVPLRSAAGWAAPSGLSLRVAQATAKLQEAERKLHEQKVMLEAVTLERDQAVQELRARGPGPMEEAPVSAPGSHVSASSWAGGTPLPASLNLVSGRQWGNRT